MEWNATELTLLVSAVSASLVSIIYTIQKSRCSTVDCGCIHCVRNVEETPDIDPTMAPPPPAPHLPLRASAIFSPQQPRRSSSVQQEIRRINSGGSDTNV
mgnify:FL=1